MITIFKTSSHYPMLIRAFECSTGDVLEMGTGMYSTPLLHWLAADAGRKLVSYDNDRAYIRLNHYCQSPLHELRRVADWDEADIEREWGLVLIDHHPGERRAVDAIRVAPFARLVVVHDTEPRYASVYRYERLNSHYQYRYDYKKFKPFTSVFSNFDDLRWCHD